MDDNLHPLPLCRKNVFEYSRFNYYYNMDFWVETPLVCLDTHYVCLCFILSKEMENQSFNFINCFCYAIFNSLLLATIVFVRC